MHDKSISINNESKPIIKKFLPTPSKQSIQLQQQDDEQNIPLIETRNKNKDSTKISAKLSTECYTQAVTQFLATSSSITLR